ncbi:MAG: glutathione peroxidase [Myxococcota bacterium]
MHEFEVQSITGEPVSLADYAGKLCLVVNVASACGLTPQYAGLRQLHEAYGERGFTVLAFPCNQFGAQEPGTNAEVQAFAQERYGASFPMFAKIEVNGEGAAPLYRYLKGGHPDESGSEEIAWNFTKFLVGPDGQVVARFGPKATPESLAPHIEAQLG